MINKLEKLIKENNFEDFKTAFGLMTINAHHREQLYKLSYISQQEQFLDFLKAKTSIGQDKEIDFFIEAIGKGVKIKNFDRVSKFDDMALLTKFNSKGVALTSSQDDKFLINFLEKYPITTLMNLKKIMFGAFQNEKTEFIDYITKKELDKDILFYSSLCAIKFEKRETFSHMLKNAMKYNPDIIQEVRKLKDNYVQVMNGRSYVASKDEIESFIDKTLIETFAFHLEEELKHKPQEEIKPIKKKMKI